MNSNFLSGLKESHHPYAISTILCWALAFVFTRIATGCFSPAALGCLRYIIASLLLLVMGLKMHMKLPEVKDIPLFLVSGAFGFFLYMIFFNLGLTMVNSATGSVIIATAPVMTALIAWRLYGEKLKPLQWAAISIEFAGVLVLLLLNGIFSMNQGVIWLIVAAVLLSSYNLIQRKLTRKYSGFEASVYSIFAGTLMLMIDLPKALRELPQASLKELIAVLILGIFSSAVAYVTWSLAFEKAEKTTQVSNYMFVTPFLATLLGFLIAGERPEGATIIGGAMILSGVFLFNFGQDLFGKK